MREGFAIILVIWLVGIVCWTNNMVDFGDCDFKEDYSCEIIHGIGLVMPPASIVTAWVESDGSK